MATGDGTSTYAVVASPPAEPPPVGLIASLGPSGGRYLDPPDAVPPAQLPPFNADRPQPTVPDNPATVAGPLDPPQRWEAGFQFLPEQCVEGAVTDPCAPLMGTVTGQDALVKAEPFLVWTGDVCSSFGWEAHDYMGRAVRALLAVESAKIAKELWTGTQAKASGWPNPYLASPASDTLTNGPVSARLALDCLEGAAAVCGSGQRVAIHCTAQMGSIWSGLDNTLRANNGMILTYRGSIIIPDAGYDGSGPDGQPAVAGSQWAYATLLPQVRRGPIVVSPDSFEEALDRSVNTITWRAWRAAAATFATCCLVAAEIDAPLCLIGGVS